ncbi:ATP-binding protein [Caulobacter hibisci]|uniref:histidine kinase n=1 Tax=Caulobacter hibisci TaxID=2035993 RepID=A0ABS0SZ36_9CAUL|nr:ATP-binding protein [Caulobacter hibisci]MBI1684895.1 response regulator [Caulobacter hibisci]
MTEATLLRQQDVLAKFGEMALRSENLDDILTEACRLVGEALGTDLAKVMEIQADGLTLLVRAGVGWNPGVVGHLTVEAVKGSSEGYALNTGEPVMSVDIDHETRFEYADFIKDHGVKCIVSVIILGAEGKGPFGILQVDSRTPGHFVARDTKFLRGYANLIAAAVDRLQVGQKMRAAQAELRISESALRKANETLEERVAERTHAFEAEHGHRELAEEKLRQSQKMEAIGQLTGGIAHDFNNLLTGITGSLDLIRRRMDAGRTQDIARFMDAASTSAQRAAALTHRLLAFARRQSLDAKPSDVNALIAGMDDMLRRTLGEQVRFEVVLGAGLWPALTDANQLENAILNLTLNARDAMPEGGRLRIETTNTQMHASQSLVGEEVTPGPYIVVCVSDTGTGMTPEVVAKAFDPFFSTKAPGQGTGLGLSMIYGFAKQSGGHVRIDSAVGAGTTVKLYLPRANSAERLIGDVAEAATPQGRGENVLVVEDDPTVRLLIVEVLTELGYVGHVAADSREALPVLRSDQRIDLMGSDVGLPGLNGRKLADLARDIRPGLKVLFVTGYAESAAVRGDFLAPGMDLLTKPFTLDALGAKIREMIES